MTKDDIEKKIAAHPLAAIGIAFALGAIAALVRGTRRPTSEEVETRSTIGGAIAGALGALAMRIAKDYALGHVSGAAKKWFDARTGATSVREARASKDPAVESFLEH